MKPLNFTLEFSHLIALIKLTWNIPDQQHFEQAARDAFNEGLHDGRFWIDNHLTFRVGELINSDKELCPLRDRSDKTISGSSADYLYDSLYLFDRFISSCANTVYNNQTRYGKWNYSSRADKLTSKLSSKYDIKKLSPIKVTRKEEDLFIKSFKGLPANGIRSYPTAKRICYSQSKYYAEEQAIGFTRNLMASIYSHGLACAEEQNNRSLTATLIPIYKKYREMDLNPDNGQEILEQARKNEWLSLFEALEKLTFSSTEEFEKHAKEHKKRTEIIAKETADEKETRIADHKEKMKKMTKEIFSEINSGESDKKEEEKNLKQDVIIESFREKMSVYTA